MEIRNLSKIAATGKTGNSFVGIKVSENKIEFHYPETYNLSENDTDLRRDILAILRTISLAKTKTRGMSSYNTNHDSKYDLPLSSFLWIIGDYLKYGRYDNPDKKKERGIKGRIDWKRTMKSLPIVSRKNIVYTEIISERKRQKDNLLTEIFFFCVKKAIDSIGWIYSITFNDNGIDYYGRFNKQKYISAINTEISHTFDDSKRLRLLHMRNIITGLDDNKTNTREILYGVDSYEYVYERMIDSMFSNIDNIKDFYPSAKWELALEQNPIKSTNLRPDTIITRKDPTSGEKSVYIVDAKYYRYGTTFDSKDMPETTSIQKQITYGEYIKAAKRYEFDRIYSAFLLPYSKTENVKRERFSHNLEFVGIGKAEWYNDYTQKNSFRDIFAILIDTRFLVENWTRKNSDNIDNLIETIESNINWSIKQ